MRIFDKINSDTKVKILQASVHVILLATLFTAWSIQLFVIGLVLGWFFWLTGVHGSLHKYSSHRSFTAKNKAIEVFILFMGTIIGLGSNLSWAATHRKHHQHSDQEGDPHSIHTDGGGFWRAVKIYFYYFPTYLINPRTVKDLTSDPLHKWFHKHYYKVIFSYVVILALVDPVYVGYFWALPVFYVYTGISYITVIAHNITIHKVIGYKNYVTTDQTYNWSVASLLLPGEGNHNNHHALPGAAKNKMTDRDIDTGYWYLKLIGNVPENQTYHQHFIT